MTFARTALCLCGLLLACNKPAADKTNPPTAEAPQIESNLTVSQAAELLKTGPQVQLVDVRSNSEWAGGYIPGAKHIPVDDIPTRMAEIDKNKTVLLYCAAGGRSHRAMEMLKAAGYRDVRHLADGISGWKAAGMTITK